MKDSYIIGYLGPEGTYSEAAAELLAKCIKTDSLLPFSGIESVVRAVAEGRVEYGVVPIENSLEGAVNITLDLLAHEVELYIIREIILPISHSLFSKAETGQINSIASHPQALAQCRRYLAVNYPSAAIQPVESTAAAARMVSQGVVDAAIASRRAGELFNLITLEQNIQDHPNNQTRFVTLCRTPQTEKMSKMSLVCRIQGDSPGSLCQILLEFATRGVNLTRIESRPARTGLGEYVFFIDLEGAMDQPAVAEAIQAVTANSLWLKNLGMYCSI